jgi:hypothetical protein
MTENTYYAGDIVRATATFVDPSGANFDPASVTLLLTDANGDVVASPAIVRDSLGLYHADIVVSSLAPIGSWTYTWNSTGGGAGLSGFFLVGTRITAGAPLVSATSFRANFPAFVDRGDYPDTSVNFWIAVATKLLNPCAWHDFLGEATQLFIAHNLILEKQAVNSAAFGGTPGLVGGAIASKSVDKVSVSYDTSGSMEKDAGHWNMTAYGLRFAQLTRYFGAGPVQL